MSKENPLLLLHGALGSKDQFHNLEQALNPKLKTYALNFSGHGREPLHHPDFTIENFANEVLDFLNQHGIERINVFGYSMGGYVAYWLARFHPERIDKIFSLGTKLKWNEEEAQREIKMLNPEKIIEKVPAFAKALSERHGEQEWKDVMHKTAQMMQHLAHAHINDEDFLKIDHPILLTRGEKDTMVKDDETKHVHQLLKNSTYKAFEGVEHPFEKVPVELLKNEIENFFLHSR